MRTNIVIPRVQQKNQLNNIAIFGSADVDPQHPLYQEVFSVARYLAYQGKVIVNGGGPGVMDAATKGAQAGGGMTIAVTFEPKGAADYEGRMVENHFDKEIKASNYMERMFGLMDQSDAFIYFQGGTGTLSEWTTAWLLAHIYYGHHKPLILFGAFWAEVMEMINEHFFIGEMEKKVYKIVKNEVEMIQALAEFEKELLADE